MHVIKVGGSLFDLPNLGTRLRAWLDALTTPDVILVPGGGSAADVVRDLDRRHRLGEEKAHWLALRALTLNAHALAAVVPRTVVVERLDDRSAAIEAGMVPILDPYCFARADETCADHLPHLWTVTSDSVAVRVAVVSRAARLILLKSVTIPDGMSWTEAGRCGYVDAYFAGVVGGAPKSVVIHSVNFREIAPEDR